MDDALATKRFRNRPSARENALQQLVTFDHNCLIDLEENRPAAQYLRRLITADQASQIKVRVVAAGASEQLAGGARSSNFGQFKQRLVKLGLERAEILKPLLYYGLGYWDWGIWGGDPVSSALEKDLHAVLFPGIEFSYEDYCSLRHIDIDRAEAKLDRRWVNARCDVLGLWSHIHHGGNIFVTSDRNFHKRTKKPVLIALGVGKICTPVEAVEVLELG